MLPRGSMDASQRFLVAFALICFALGYWAVSFFFGKKEPSKLPSARTEPSAGGCPFCGGAIENGDAAEAISNWLPQYAELDKVMVPMCGACQRGWLNRLETEASPLVLPLIDGSRSVFGLSDRERLVLSRWAAKTAYMLYAASGGPDRSQLAELAEEEHLPGGVAVFAEQHVPTRRFS
jgi:hypothetical protein